MSKENPPMRKNLLPLALALVLVLAGCGGAVAPADDAGTTIVATTYPVYCFTSEVVRDVPDVTVRLMIDQPVSCLHDYTLSVSDMKALDGADVLVLSGAGLEDSMQSALDAVADTPRIDCSAGVALLHSAEEHDHDGHEGHSDAESVDPHIWLDPARAAQMVRNVADGLAALDPDHADTYRANADAAEATLAARYDALRAQLDGIGCRELITFHDGFQYFAAAFDLTILRAIEEEAGSEASAKEATEICALVREHRLPALFTEVNGATATAEMLARETGVAVRALDLGMSGPTEGAGLSCYLDVLARDVAAIREANA